MKKMFIGALVISAALAACGGKRKPATGPSPDPGSAAGSDMGSAAGSDGAGSDAAPPPAGGSGM